MPARSEHTAWPHLTYSPSDPRSRSAFAHVQPLLGELLRSMKKTRLKSDNLDSLDTMDKSDEIG